MERESRPVDNAAILDRERECIEALISH